MKSTMTKIALAVALAMTTASASANVIGDTWDKFNTFMYTPSITDGMSPATKKFVGGTAGVIGLGAVAGSLPVALVAVPVAYVAMTNPPVGSNDRVTVTEIYGWMIKDVSKATPNEERALQLGFEKMQALCEKNGRIAGGMKPHWNFKDWEYAVNKFTSAADEYDRTNKIKSGGFGGGNYVGGEWLSTRQALEKRIYADVTSPRNGKRFGVNHQMMFDMMSKTQGSISTEMEMKFECDRGTIVGANIGGQDQKIENKDMISVYIPTSANPDNLTVLVAEWDSVEQAYRKSYTEFTADEIAIIKGEATGKKVNMD
ncbi:MAG: hypothetical protein PHP57_06385 [Sideroxydans sp.]|nr:hypothetical protein [Sideroxydans sp.]